MAMQKSDRQGFWSDLSEKSCQAFTTTFGEDELTAAIDSNSAAKSPMEKLKFLESLAASRAAKEDTPVEVRDGMLHVVGLLQSELGDKAASEKTWRELAARRGPTRPNLAALSNLATSLNAQEKFAEAETLLRTLTPLIQFRLGEHSPQALGCYRMLAESVKMQGRSEQARSLLVDAKVLIERIEDKQLRKDETEALEQAMLLVEA